MQIQPVSCIKQEWWMFPPRPARHLPGPSRRCACIQPVHQGRILLLLSSLLQQSHNLQ